MVLAYGLHYLNNIEERLDRVNQHLMPSLKILQRFENEIQVAHQTLDLNFYNNLNSPGFPQPWSRHLIEIEEHLSQVSKKNPTALAMLTRLRDIQQNIFERNTKKLLEEVPLIRRWLDREITNESLLGQEELRTSLNRLLVVLSVSLLLSAGVFYFVHYQLKRFSNLVTAIKHVAQGHYQFFFPSSKALHKKSTDEVDLVAREFNSMVMKLEKREQKLLEAERLAAIGRMSAQVAHEIRNPLNAMSLNLEILSEEVVDLPDGTQTINTLLKEVKRLERITANYLEASRLKSPHLQDLKTNENKLVSVSEAIEQTDALFKEITTQKNIEIKLTNMELGRQAKHSSDTLATVVINLIRNSIQSIDHDGEIEIGLEQHAANLTLYVEDSGRGIPKKLRKSVLKPFYSTHKNGTGLGFSIVQSYLDKIGGKLEIKEPLSHSGIRIECDLGHTEGENYASV